MKARFPTYILIVNLVFVSCGDKDGFRVNKAADTLKLFDRPNSSGGYQPVSISCEPMRGFYYQNLQRELCYFRSFRVHVANVSSHPATIQLYFSTNEMPLFPLSGKFVKIVLLSDTVQLGVGSPVDNLFARLHKESTRLMRYLSPNESFYMTVALFFNNAASSGYTREATLITSSSSAGQQLNLKLSSSSVVSSIHLRILLTESEVTDFAPTGSYSASILCGRVGYFQ